MQPFVKSGELVVLGVVQEQHPDRAKLYKQWRQIDWPILVDSLNLLDLAVVPVPVTIDESGIVRHAGRMPSSLETEFVRKTYNTVKIGKNFNRAERADPQKLRQQVSQSGSAAAYRDLGDAYFFEPASESLDRCIEAYQQAIKLDPRDGRAHFRLGAALRKRAESSHRRPGDAQAAVGQWGEALATNPNQYIWRRRIQQYGPRLDKPYNFYSWVEQARSEIKARGEQAAQLAGGPT
ncbi:MAG: tetratricopeptide repeat protein, partial [Planctomycetes bacterium]|nr:tetratricopeptide repeat protein [Planctomycetota bacterium]